MKLAKTLIGLGLLLGALQAHAEFVVNRCYDWHDSLNPEQAEGRREWAKKCVTPLAKSLLNGTQYFADSADRAVRRAYPVFGLPSSEGEPTNPLNYIAPVDPNAECNLPEGYDIVFFCAAG